MGKGDRCSIGICNYDRRYPDKIVIRSHVTNFQFHGLPKDEKLCQIWHSQIHQGRKDYTENKNAKYESLSYALLEGTKQTLQEAPMRYAMDDDPDLFVKPGPGRKLKLEIELLLVMMRLRLGLLVHDLAFRFQISEALVSSIFITWIELMRLELCHLIVWPSKNVIKENLPSCFKTFYPNVRCIIDCTEIFIETPSSLDTQVQCWSDYKHHCTIKFLVVITTSGMFSYVSPCYGGRASDKFIFNNCTFIFDLEPNDQVMADRGFKIKEDLMVVQARLAIPPSTCGKLSMPSGDVLETSKIANVRIYVEQAIGRLKTFLF
ncbi:unnamed protein product [Mytilus coruscus]|uniref:DDE Tnp4 domain-containing protein n=1 Tax=Mytilus coruscus TaxID=42192 RepID=A0A6J8BV81_MYTCO|nr:unnamed protein product [Mytilus coruscus]